MNSIHQLWQKKTLFNRLLYPSMWVFQSIVVLRKWFLSSYRQQQFQTPIIVVGNLTTGGVGKTPLVIALVEYLKTKGLSVGVVSRGYKAQITHFPHEVSVNDTAKLVGDEPFLIALKTQVPVVISPKRVQAVQHLLQHHHVQVVISDDGLQHYQMGRAIEIAVIDGIRGLGNQLCLPAGPLRESSQRLKTVDFTVVNGGEWAEAYRMHLVPKSFVSLQSKRIVSAPKFNQPVAAVAGIGHPERFFNTLNQLSIQYQPYIFPDHHQFNAADFSSITQEIIMTEKDAVKCYAFATDKMYYLTVQANIEQSFWDALWAHPCLKKLHL